MRRYAQTALLILLGGMLLKLVITGAHLRYVRGVHAPLLVFAGVALLVVAAANLWRDLRSPVGEEETTATGLTFDGMFGSDRERPARTPDPGGDEVVGDHRDRALAAGRAAAAHEGLEAATGAPVGTAEAALTALDAPTAVFAVLPVGSVGTVSDAGAADAQAAGGDPADVQGIAPPGEPSPAELTGGEPTRTRAGWALLAAALTVLVLSPPALGSFPATHAGTAPPAPSNAAVPSGDPVSMSLVEYASHAASGGQGLAGRRVQLVGFILAGPRGEPYLGRLAVGCCAAGARPVKVGLTGDLPGVLTIDAWVEVVGTYTDQVDRDPLNSEPIPYVSVDSVTVIDPPADPYES